jgi:hypothetical protein
MTGMVSASGRVFYIADDGPAGIKHPEHKLERWTLFARDAFNGLLLWKRGIADWGARAWSPEDYPFPFGPWTVNPRNIHRQLIADGDRVYVTLGFSEPVSVLDAASGDTLLTLEGTGFTSEILLDGGHLYAVVDRSAQKAGKYTKEPEKSVIASDPNTGKILWEQAGFFGIEDRRRRGLSATLTRLLLTSGGGRLFAFDHDELLALDASTGQELWRVARPKSVDQRNLEDMHPVNDQYDLGSMLYWDDIVYCWQPHFAVALASLRLQACTSLRGWFGYNPLPPIRGRKFRNRTTCWDLTRNREKSDKSSRWRGSSKIKFTTTAATKTRRQRSTSSIREMGWSISI